MGERTEVAGALLLLAAHDAGARPLLRDGDGEERVALVVAQADVEAGPVTLDERVLEHERFDLVGGDDPLDGGGSVHHRGAEVATSREMAGDPLA